MTDRDVESMRKGTWSVEEDHLLKEAINEQHEKLHNQIEQQQLIFDSSKIDWVSVSDIVKTRTGKQCRERWINHLDPSLKKEKWTKQEDEQLLSLGSRFPGKWAEISRHIEGRSQNQVKIRQAPDYEYK